jgi:hypothetical protein
MPNGTRRAWFECQKVCGRREGCSSNNRSLRERRKVTPQDRHQPSKSSRSRWHGVHRRTKAGSSIEHEVMPELGEAKPAQWRATEAGRLAFRPKQIPQSPQRHLHREAARTTTGRVHMGLVGSSYEIMAGGKGRFHDRNTRSYRGLDWCRRYLETKRGMENKHWGWLFFALGLIGLGITIAMVVKMPA